MNKTVLVIGAGGFAGSYLLKQLLGKGDRICATLLSTEKISCKEAEIFPLDITDGEAVERLILTLKPDEIYHLAALSSAKISWENPVKTMEINLIGTINLLEAVKRCRKEAKVLLIGSGEEYGLACQNGLPLKEDDLPIPCNPYAVSKLAQNHMGRVYHKGYGLSVLSVRAFNHIGAGQGEGFVVPDFCKQIAMAELGLIPPEIKVGNLSAVRDFTDVKDVVRAYELLMKKGIPGKTYNVGGGTVCSVEEILQKLLSLSKKPLTVVSDPSKMRPADTPVISGDIRELTKDTGFAPVIPLEQTLRECLVEWRERICRKGKYSCTNS